MTKGVTQQSNIKEDVNVKFLLANVTTLEVLAISGFFVSDDACYHIIHSGKHLKKLELNHNSINGKIALRLIHELIIQTDSGGLILDELNTSNNNLNQSTSDLGCALKNLLDSERCKLKILKCAGCHINDGVCGYIASGIQCNHKVVCLDLSCNDITTVGGIKLMASLQQNSCLKELSMSGNPLFAVDDISSQTRLGEAISKMLEFNHTLVNFNLDCNNLDITTLKKISNGLNNNQALKILAFNVSKCNTSELNTLIQTLSTKLTYINISDTCSLFSSDNGCTIEVKNTDSLLSLILTTLNLSTISINQVIISKTSVSDLNFLECSLSCSQLQSLLGSLEGNCVVMKLSLRINGSLTHTEHEDLRSSLESTLKKNCILTHLTLLGAVSNEVLQGLEAGIKANDSIRVLSVQVTDLQFDTIKFVQSLEISNILNANLHPLVRIVRPSTTSVWQVEAYNPSMTLFLKFISFLNQGSIKHSLLSQLSSLNFDETNGIDDSLTSSLIQDSSVQCLNIPTSWTIGEKAVYALERMISCNNCLQYLSFDSINDSVVAAITKGLKDNKILQALKMNIVPLSERALSQLLQSLSNHPLKLIPQGHYIIFVRFISDLQIKEVSVRTVIPVTTVSSNLERILQCLSSVHCQNLTIASLQQVSINKKAIGNALKDLLRNCRSLKILSLECELDSELIQYLAAGLKDNNTLYSLEIKVNANSPSTRFITILPCFLSGGYSRKGYLLSKISDMRCWKLEQLHCFDERSFQNLFLIHNHIEIDLLICKCVDTVSLKLHSENIKLILIIFKSIECGTFPLKCIRLVCDTVEGDESKIIGNAIERMLIVNKSLETLTIVHFQDIAFEDHIVSGLCQTSTLTRVVINNKLQSTERNSLVQKVIKADFSDSSISEIQINANISLHRNSIKTDPDWRIQMDSRLGKRHKAIRIWEINSEDKNTIIRAFFLLNQAVSSCNHSHSRIIIGKSVLDNLKKLDISHTCISFIALFKILQSDSRIMNLNLSHCTQAGSVDISQRDENFKSMLISNTSLELLNLTGLMDETLISSLIEVLPSCSLKSLTLDLDTGAYAFDKVEALISSYVNSEVIQLTFTNICHLQKEVDAQCVPQCISLECHLALPFSVSLFKTYSSLFMLISINKHFSRVNLTLGTMDRLSIKVYLMFFASVNQGYQMDSPMNLLQSLKALQIDITHDTFELVVAVMESLQYCHTSCLEELRLSHDRSIFVFTSKCQELASCYEQLLSSNKTLHTVNFGHINDVIAQRIAAGLKSSESKLRTLQFNASLLTISSMISLFRSSLVEV